jgi:hypothetical protein
MSLLQHFIRIHSVIKYAGMFPPVADIQAAIALVTRYRVKSEIIGQCLYCFTNRLIGFQLATTGFWYSFKHCAWVFSGAEKKAPAGSESLGEIRRRLGCQQVKGALYV